MSRQVKLPDLPMAIQTTKCTHMNHTRATKQYICQTFIILNAHLRQYELYTKHACNYVLARFNANAGRIVRRCAFSLSISRR